jgi:quercetin dioxygenase-like cupin family protein
MDRRALFALAALAVTLSPLHAQDTAYPVVPLLSASTSIVGEPIQYPATGAAHVTAAIVTVAPGGKTIMHEHGVPMFAYILDGELTVDYGAHGKRVYRKGDALMEAMTVPHFGSNTGAEPVRILAVYMGSQGAQEKIPVK